MLTSRYLNKYLKARMELRREETNIRYQLFNMCLQIYGARMITNNRSASLRSDNLVTLPSDNVPVSQLQTNTNIE